MSYLKILLLGDKSQNMTSTTADNNSNTSSDPKITTEPFDEEVDKFAAVFKGLEQIDLETDKGELNPISKTTLESWESDFQALAKNILTQNALANTTVDKVIANSDSKTRLKERYLFNVTVDTIGSPSFANNQKSSGRCWIFASSNVSPSEIQP